MSPLSQRRGNRALLVLRLLAFRRLALRRTLFAHRGDDPDFQLGLDFLAEVGGDGYFPINFCKMLPYAGTPIEALRG